MFNIKRVSTGLYGLDARLDGGIPENSTIILKSEPNNFTYFILQQFLNESLKNGKPGIYLCVERSVDRVMESMMGQGIDVKKLVEEQLLVFVDFSRKLVEDGEAHEILPTIEKGVITVQNLDDKNEAKMGIEAALGTLGNLEGIRMVCESTPYIMAEDDTITVSRFWGDLERSLRDYHITTLHCFPSELKRDLCSAMEQRVEGVISLTVIDFRGDVRARLDVEKMMYTLRLPKNLIMVDMIGDKVDVAYYERIG